MTGWSELTAADAGRIVAALEAYAEDHPEADVLLDLADQIATHAVLISDEPTSNGETK